MNSHFQQRNASDAMWLLAAASACLSSTATYAQETGASLALDEVIITAQRREETLQKTAITMNAIQGEDMLLQGKTDMNEILRTVPSVLIQGGPRGANYYIRGVGPTLDTDPSVNVSVDGIYQTNGIINATYDVERVEVLKGPQGLLYGRNATAGAVNLITANPTLDGNHASASIKAGNYSAVRTEAMINMPLNETVAFRGAFLSDRHDGYMSNGMYDNNSYAGRVKVLFKPSDDLSILLSADSTQIGGRNIGRQYIANDSPQGAVWFASGFTQNLRDPPDPKYINDGFPRGRLEWRKTGFYSQIDWNVGLGTLTYIPSYYTFHLQGDSPGPVRGSFSFDDQVNSQITHELRLSSNAESSIKWLAGAYFLKYSNRDRGPFGERLVPDGASTVPAVTWIHQPLAPANTVNTLDTTKSWAVFTQATFSFTDTLRLTGGARYTRDEKGTEFVRKDPMEALIPGNAIGQQSQTNSATTWKLGLEYDVAPASLLFLNLSRGYKSGGYSRLSPVFTGTTVTSWLPETYKPEYVTAYELGSKNRFLGDTLQVNAAVYYYDYTDIQQFILSPPLGPGQPPRGSALNVADSRTYGAELEVDYALTRNDLLHVSVAYTNARFGNFTYGPTASFPTLNRSGTPYPLAPDWQETLGYEHIFDLPNGGTLSASADLRFSSSYIATIEPHPDVFQPSFHRSDARLTYQSPSKNWSLGAYINNIEDVGIRQFVFGFSPGPATPANGYYTTQLAPPRTYGLSFSAKY